MSIEITMENILIALHDKLIAYIVLGEIGERIKASCVLVEVS